MIKNFENITVKSKYSDNYYDSFQVNTALNEIYYIQRDARRNGQVARCFTISVNEINTDVLIEAYSADSGRYEQFVRTQCLELALQLLEEAKAELRHINEVDTINNVNNKVAKKMMMKNVKASISKILSNTKTFVSELLFGKDCLYEDELQKYKAKKQAFSSSSLKFPRDKLQIMER